MSLNRTAIEWCDFTWNPIVGCTRGCKYCWARAQAQRSSCPLCKKFVPHEHAERLGDPYRRKIPSNIFVCSMGDIFDPEIENEKIHSIFNVIKENPHHIFFVLTKNIGRIVECDNLIVPDNLWLGVSVDGKEYLRGAHSVIGVEILCRTKAYRKFVSFEPLLAPVDFSLYGLDWVIIGGQTRPTVIPQHEWVENIVEQAFDDDVDVFMKENVFGPGGYRGPVLKEFPNELRN